MCEVQGVCPPTRIWLSCNACNSQRWFIWVNIPWTHEEQEFVLWVAPILVWVYCNVQYPNATCQYHEEGSMGGNITVCNFWINKSFCLDIGSFQGGQAVLCDERWSPWGPYTCSPDTVVHVAMDFSYWTYMVQWICVCLSKDVNCGMCWVLTEFQIDAFTVILVMFCIMGGRWGLCSSGVYVG